MTLLCLLCATSFSFAYSNINNTFLQLNTGKVGIIDVWVKSIPSVGKLFSSDKVSQRKSRFQIERFKLWWRPLGILWKWKRCACCSVFYGGSLMFRSSSKKPILRIWIQLNIQLHPCHTTLYLLPSKLLITGDSMYRSNQFVSRLLQSVAFVVKTKTPLSWNWIVHTWKVLAFSKTSSHLLRVETCLPDCNLYHCSVCSHLHLIHLGSRKNNCHF